MEDEAKDPAAAPEDPEIATLLEFEPVPRRNKRHDGWSAAHQRGFIAALATCGNIDRAAQAVDRTQSGAWTVRNSAGADGFKESWEAALSLYHRRNPRRAPPPPMARPARPVAGHARNVGALRAAREARGADADGEVTRAEAEAFWAALSRRYWRKLKDERRCRLGGRIVEADFYVRQLTFIEIVFDLGGRAQELLEGLRSGGVGPLDIVATPGAALLEKVRRAFWAEKGEADRPSPAPLGDHDDARGTGGRTWYNAARDGDYEAWCRRRDEQRRLGAEAQAAWEERARGEAEAQAEGACNGDPERGA
jgi:hypothetical protein